MSSVSIGKTAERKAADFLQTNGYRIIDRNWRTRWCEIDLVAEKSGMIYFVEVKHRTRSHQGAGLEYVTKRKLEQMSFAAQLWVGNHKWQGGYELSAVEVSGPDFTVTGLELSLT